MNIKLALPVSEHSGGAMCAKNIANALPTVPLACNNNNVPSLLVSYVYLKGFLKHYEKFCFRDWVLDSGAFSTHNSATPVDLQCYINTCKKLMSTNDRLTEVFALDVIGNAEASLRNCDEMCRQGIKAIPTYHIGEPLDFLIHIAKCYPKIALGGVARKRGADKLKWAEKCFSKVWPKKIHGFGFGSDDQILGLPWHSVDASNWELGPCAFGQWKKFGRMSVRGSNHNLRSQVLYYLDLEKRAQFKWRREMAKLDTEENRISVRLAYNQVANNTLVIKA